MRKAISLLCVLVMSLCMLTGCGSLFHGRERLFGIKGDIECEFHITSNGKINKPVDIKNVPFEKDMFIKLFNEDRSYDPDIMRHRLDKCELKLDPQTQTEEWKKIDDSQIMITAKYEEGKSTVMVYRYNSKLYFFVLNIGGRGKPEEQGSYYKELSKEMDEYWRPVLDKVLEAG